MREHTSPHPPFVRFAARSGPSLSVGLRMAMVLGAVGLAVSLAAPGPVLAARPALSNGNVSPLSGTTATTFVFSVTYSSSPPKAARSVDALVANRTVTLSLVPGSGSAENGLFRGTALLPAGSWPVVFEATTATGLSPEPLPMLQPVVVTLLGPTPTPQPTAPPTPVATATPAPTSTRVPTPAPSAITATPIPSSIASPSAGNGGPSGSGEPTPFGTTVAGESSTGLVSASPSAVPSAGDGDVEQQLSTFLTGGVVAVGLLGAIGFAAIYADRRRAAASPAAGPPGAQSPQSTTPARVRSSRTGGWEDYALDNEPIGTVEPEPPPTDE
ncbi:MAG: hypothetical protein ABIQ05_06315 [Candidatus Limnocylindria bacterium]